jgi:hypothetical protein
MRPIHRLLAGLVIAAVALPFYNRHADVENFALESSSRAPLGKWNGVNFTAYLVKDIKAVISRHQGKRSTPSHCEPLDILWLGNSQLHLVNQFRQGDQIAPYWMRGGLSCPEVSVPFGFSLANANLQEQYVLATYAVSRLPVRLILLELCFDDMREDGLRTDFSDFLDPADLKRLTGNPAGHEIMAAAQSAWHQRARADENKQDVTTQALVEDWLNDALADVWPLWRERAQQRGQVMLDLYFMRNAALGIKPTTVRKMIAPRYARNMGALRQLLVDARRDGVKVIAYIAPLRQDVPMPYNPDQYQAWKNAISMMAETYGAELLNLETAVPPQFWGSNRGDDIDFMHFRGEGHRIMAKTLLPYVERAR